MIKALTKALIGAIASGMVTLFLTAFTWSVSHTDALDYDSQHILQLVATMLNLSPQQQSAVHTLLAAVTDNEPTGTPRYRLRTGEQALTMPRTGETNERQEPGAVPWRTHYPLLL